MTTRKVKMDVPGTAKGTALEVPGLGLLINGEVNEVEEDQVAQYRALGFFFPESGQLTLPLKPEQADKQDTETVQEATEGGE